MFVRFAIFVSKLHVTVIFENYSRKTEIIERLRFLKIVPEEGLRNLY